MRAEVCVGTSALAGWGAVCQPPPTPGLLAEGGEAAVLPLVRSNLGRGERAFRAPRRPDPLPLLPWPGRLPAGPEPSPPASSPGGIPFPRGPVAKD